MRNVIELAPQQPQIEITAEERDYIFNNLDTVTVTANDTSWSGIGEVKDKPLSEFSYRLNRAMHMYRIYGDNDTSFLVQITDPSSDAITLQICFEDNSDDVPVTIFCGAKLVLKAEVEEPKKPARNVFEKVYRNAGTKDVAAIRVYIKMDPDIGDEYGILYKDADCTIPVTADELKKYWRDMELVITLPDAEITVHRAAFLSTQKHDGIDFTKCTFYDPYYPIHAITFDTSEVIPK